MRFKQFLVALITKPLHGQSKQDAIAAIQSIKETELPRMEQHKEALSL